MTLRPLRLHGRITCLARAERVRAAAAEWIGTPWSDVVSRRGIGVDCGRLVDAIVCSIFHVNPSPFSVATTIARRSADVAFDAIAYFVARHRMTIVEPTFVEPGDVVFEFGSEGELAHASIVSEVPPSAYQIRQRSIVARGILTIDSRGSILIMRPPWE